MSWLKENVRSESVVRLDMKMGRVPLRLLVLKVNAEMHVIVVHEPGKDPVRPLMWNCIIVMLLIEDQAPGKVPLSLLEKRSSLTKDDIVDH